ncbi:MAG: RIP metalloprotease RseP [Bacteroidales bacterium]
MELLTKAAQLIFSLSILIIFHELGHFIFARLFKVRVEKFYLFFNPWFSIFKKKVGDTEYGLGWLPLGGFVKISGMIDESLDRNQMKQPPKEWEFRTKPAYQRFLIMIGGVLFNFIMAMFLFSVIMFTWGKEYLPNSSLTQGIYCDSLALQAGFKNGDKILKVGDKTPETLNDVLLGILLHDVTTVMVERAGEEVQVNIPESIKRTIIASGKPSFIYPFFPLIIDSVMEGRPAQAAGLLKGDRIIGIDSIATPAVYDFFRAIAPYKNKEALCVIERSGTIDTLLVKFDENAKLGIALRPITDMYETKRIEYDFLSAIPAGISFGWQMLGDYVKQMKLLFTKEGISQVGGFGSIGSMFPSQWSWQEFWYLTAVLSIILAFMNILPIPALDGGHILFLIVEMITRRKPGDKFMERAQITGMILLFSLMIYANLNDLFKFVINIIY